MSDSPFPAPYPLRLHGELQEPLSRWLWLVKWLLLIPHYVALAFLWSAFAVVTVIAFFAILFTGRYPHGLFAFNRGVLRWSWRVTYYGYGALGTDRYPPFTLHEVPDYPATLQLDYPQHLSRGLVLVKWWLLALPHYLLIGAAAGAVASTADGVGGNPVTLSVLSLTVLFAGAALLFRARYPRGLYDLALGLDRWGFRVLAYATLMTDVYPPFRLDQGGADISRPNGTIEPVRPVIRGRAPTGRIIALTIGVLAVVPALALAGVGGAGLWLNAQRDAGGLIETPTRGVSSTAPAVTVEDVNLDIDRSTSTWLSSHQLGQLRIKVTPADGRPVFVGIAPQAAVDTWLAGRAHNEITDLNESGLRYTLHDGSPTVSTPAQQNFWSSSGSGAGTTELNWRATTGHWALVIANADGSPNVQAQASIAARIPSLAGVAAGLIAAGLLLLILAGALITWGASGLGRHTTGGSGSPAPQAPRTPVPVP